MKAPFIVPLFMLLVTQSFGQLPKGIVDTQDPTSSPPSPEESLSMITVPEGFNISLFAGEPDVAQPIAIEYDDRGRLWVLESFSYIEWKRTGKDRLLIFEDTDNDGRFDSRKVFWDQGNHTSGFQIGFGGVWLCDAPELLFIPDADGDDIPDGAPEVVLDGWTTEAEHNFFNGLKWGPDGWLYGRHGIKKPSNVGKPGTDEEDRTHLSCAIWRYHPVKERFEIRADGTVNPWGLDWNEEGEGFINTSVLDHFWHLVPGARYQRTSSVEAGSFHPHSYLLMEPTSDHRHWSGGQTGRKDFTGNDEAGGGHSHCGMMIYQAGSWPEKYRGRAFFSNVLGQRINMDHLDRSGSAWTASHGEDFLRSTSPWFRAVDLCQGPNGEMMMAEWTDFGECHDRDGIHRSSGRLYEVWYGDRVKRKPFDVAQESTASLIELMFHGNVWWRRKALRNLHERAAATDPASLIDAKGVEGLVEKAKTASIPDAISAIQALHALRPTDQEWVSDVYEASKDRSAIRIHLLTLTLTEEVPTLEQIQWFGSLIKNETDPAVLYRMTALLQRIPLTQRWNAAEALAEIRINAEDHNFTMMRWYGFEPLVVTDPARAMKTALQPGHPRLSQSIARRAVSAESLPAVVDSLKTGDLKAQPLSAILTGTLEALPARAETPENWSELYAILKEQKNPEILKQVFQLALRFGDPAAEEEMVERVFAASTSADERLDYVRLLVAARSSRIADRIPELIQFPELAIDAIRAEAIFATDESAPRLLALLSSEETASDRKRSEIILETLAAREDFADALVNALLSGELEKEMIPSYVARQIMMVTSKKSAFTRHLGIDEKDASGKAAQIALWKKRLSDDYLAQGSAADGKNVYQQVCAACHQMYGEGGVIGPDLTGSGRADLDYFLINVLYPSEDVSPGYRLVTLFLKNGRTLVGNIVEENEQVITFRQIGQVERIDTSEVVSREVADISLMPSGLLDSLRREDVRDLVLYLRTEKPIP